MNSSYAEIIIFNIHNAIAKELLFQYYANIL